MPELISCESIGYQQRGVDILADINWRIETGQHWAVLGPNGSGKTTLLRIVCGYLWPTSGKVLRLGQALVDLSELRRSIGWISSGMIAEIPPNDTGLETAVTGRLAQIGLKRFPHGGPNERDFRAAARELADLGCAELSEKPFGILSQGERQQVLIARARMAKPMLLVLDEPCAGMDPGVRERFLAWLNGQLASSLSPTVVLVTHHVEEILPGIQNTLILSAGRVHASGPADDILNRTMIEEVYRTKLARVERIAGRFWPLWGSSE